MIGLILVSWKIIVKYDGRFYFLGVFFINIGSLIYKLFIVIYEFKLNNIIREYIG